MGLTERVNVRAGEVERLLLVHVLAGDVVAPALVVDVHHVLVARRLIHTLGGRYPPLYAEWAVPVGAVLVVQSPLVFNFVRVVVVVGCVRHRVGKRGSADVVRGGHVAVDGRGRGVVVLVPERPLLLDVPGCDGLLVAVLPVVVLERVEVVVLTELRDVVRRSVEQVGLVGGVARQPLGGGRLEVGEVAHAREARPTRGGVDGCFRVGAVPTGRGDEVPLAVLARRRVGPRGLAVFDGGVARVDLSAEVADGEVDGSFGRGLGCDRRLLTRFVGGLVRVGAGDVCRARGGGRCGVRQGQGRGDDRGAEHDRSGDGQGMSCLHDVCVLVIVDETSRWGSHARETAPIQR